MKRINILTVLGAAALLMQACSQDLNQNPPFNYPQSGGGGSTDLPEECLFHIGFDDNTDVDGADMQVYLSNSAAVTYVEGHNGKAYQAATGAAMILNPIGDVATKLKTLGSFTYTVWIKYDGGNTASCSLFALAHPDKYISALSLFIEGNTTENFYFKGYLNGNSGEFWFDKGADAKIPTANIAGKWAQIGFVYDASTQTASLYHNGALLCSNTYTTSGELTFDKLGKIVLGAHPSMVGETTDTDSWPASGSFYTGAMDDIYLYNKAYSATEMARQYQLQAL